jgi:dienelactone hydrolase
MTYDPVDLIRTYLDDVEDTAQPPAPADFETWQADTRKKLADCIAFQDLPKAPLCPAKLEEEECGSYIRTKWEIGTAYEKKLPFYLLIPARLEKPAPAVLALHGHGHGVKAILGLNPEGKPMAADYHQNFALELVQRGFIVACPEIAGFGEQKPAQSVNTDLGAHEALPCHFAATWAMMAGGTLLGLRVFETRRLIDFLRSRTDLCGDFIGCMGISGGGMLSYFSAALDPRIHTCVISGYYCSWRESILAMNHCICNFVPNLLNIGDLPELGALLWPRTVVVEAGTRDPIFPIRSVRKAVARLEAVYDTLGTPNRVFFDEFEGNHQISGQVAYDVLCGEAKR